MITITRKIQLNFVVEDKSMLKELYEKLYGWQRICFRAANWIATHHYMQENIKELHYLTDEVKVKLGNIEKDADGILTTSRDNTTYQVLSKNFKGQCPMGMLSALNMNIAQTYKKEAKDVRFGTKSLRSYRRDIPMPVRFRDIGEMVKQEDGNYSFSVYGIDFRTWFGRDLSGNQLIFDRAIAGEYKFCDSSICIENKKIFLLAVFQFEKNEVQLDPDKVCEAELDINYPIRFKAGKKEITIGTADEFLHRRLAIQAALRRTQASSRFNKGGKGRRLKMQATDRYKQLEYNYVTSRIHQYTYKLVDWCVKLKCGKLVLKNLLAKEEEAKADKEYLLRNWSYYGMKEKLQYKCNKFGIELIVE